MKIKLIYIYATEIPSLKRKIKIAKLPIHPFYLPPKILNLGGRKACKVLGGAPSGRTAACGVEELGSIPDRSI